MGGQLGGLNKPAITLYGFSEHLLNESLLNMLLHSVSSFTHVASSFQSDHSLRNGVGQWHKCWQMRLGGRRWLMNSVPPWKTVQSGGPPTDGEKYTVGGNAFQGREVRAPSYYRRSTKPSDDDERML